MDWPYCIFGDDVDAAQFLTTAIRLLVGCHPVDTFSTDVCRHLMQYHVIGPWRLELFFCDGWTLASTQASNNLKQS